MKETTEDMEAIQEEFDKKAEELAGELDNEKIISKLHNFYTATYNDKKDQVQIEFDNLRIVNKLRELGFARYDTPDGAFQYVQIRNNRIKVVSDKDIKDAFEDYIRQLPDNPTQCWCKRSDGDYYQKGVTVTSWMLLEKLYKNINYYFSSTLDRLRPMDQYGRYCPIKILQDEKNVKYLFYRNCVVKIENKLATVDGKLQNMCNHQMIEYEDIKDGAIWESSIIDRDFYGIDEYGYDHLERSGLYDGVKEDTIRHYGDWGLFCECICGGADQKMRLMSLKSILGYLMHDHYECDLRAALFTDVNQDNTGAAGRTGKGLLAKALGLVLNNNQQGACKMINVPGKGFDATNPKRYSAGDISTQLIHIEDLSRRFDLEDIFVDITDRATFQKHYQNPVYKRCKFMLSMNQALKINDSSSKMGRVVIFELANFFSDKLRPGAYFGSLHGMRERRFFESDWDVLDWALFDRFMVECCEVYLSCGIVEPQDINFAKRALIEAVGGQDTYEWLSFIFSRIKTNCRATFEKTNLYLAFCKKYPGYIQTQKKFTSVCQDFLRGMNIRSATFRDGKDWFILYPDQTDTGKKLDWIVK